MKTYFNLRPMQIAMLAMIAILILPLYAGCKKSETDMQVNIEVEFNLLNDVGIVSTIFNEDDNFRFQFVIRNNTSTQIKFDPNFIGDDFFRVFRAEPQGGLVSMGKPYQNAFCQFGLGQFIIAPDTEYRFEIPWIPEEGNSYQPFCLVNKNDPLPKGKYWTSVEGPIHFFDEDRTITYESRFVIDFEIK